MPLLPQFQSFDQNSFSADELLKFQSIFIQQKRKKA